MKRAAVSSFQFLARSPADGAAAGLVLTTKMASGCGSLAANENELKGMEIIMSEFSWLHHD